MDRCADGVAAGFGHGPSVITSDIYCNQVEEKPLKSPLINSVITSNQVEENPLKSYLSDPSRHHDRILRSSPVLTGGPAHQEIHHLAGARLSLVGVLGLPPFLDEASAS